MTALLEVLAVDLRRQGDGYTLPQFLRVSDTEQRLVVDLESESSIRIEIVLATDAKIGAVVIGGPRDLDSSFQLAVHFVVDGTGEDSSVIDNGVQDEIFCDESHGYFVFGEFALANVESRGVTTQPASVTEDSASSDERTTRLEVAFKVHGAGIVLEFTLQSEGLITLVRNERGVKGHFSSIAEISNGDFGGQHVVSVPFLREGNAILLEFVLGFEGADYVFSFEVLNTADAKFNSCVSFGLDVELQESEMIPFAEDVAGVLTEISVERRSHCDLFL